MAENESPDSAPDGAAAAPDAAANAAPEAEASGPPQVHMLAHFVRDLSFENVGVIQGTPYQNNPEINVSVNLDGDNIGENRYQVNMKVSAKATHGESTRFLVELDYSGIFAFENVPESHAHPMLFIECPRLLLPFARRVIADVTRDGGYPPLMLDNIEFAGLYRQRMEEFQREQETQATT